MLERAILQYRYLLPESCLSSEERVIGRVISAIGKVENLREGLRENKVNIRANGMSMAVCQCGGKREWPCGHGGECES